MSGESFVLDLEVTLKYNGLSHTVHSKVEPVFTGDFRDSLDDLVARITQSLGDLTKGME